MNHKEIECLDFYCDKLGNAAHIKLEYLHHKGGVKKQIGFDCDDCYHCGVGEEVRPGSWDFDWDKCIFPNK